MDPTSYDGSSYEKAIIINENSELAGVNAEYYWLEKKYPGYSLSIQYHSSHDNRSYDVMLIETADGIGKKIYFDITSSYGNH